MFDKWMFALRNLSRLLERPKALQERVFEKFFRQAEIASYSPEELRDYEESVKIYRDLINVVDSAERRGLNKGRAEGRAEGRVEGLAEGEAKGRAEERLANARGLKANGVPLDIIAKSLALTKEEIDLL
jgi:predicted transposase/invertase (TIGR01784 family)